MKLLFLSLLPLLLFSQAPSAYSTLAEEIEKEHHIFSELRASLRTQPYIQAYEVFENMKQKSFAIGYELDDVVNRTSQKEEYYRRAYLLSLRALKPQRQKLKSLYFAALQTSMDENNQTQLIAYLDRGYSLVYTNKVLNAKVYKYLENNTELEAHDIVKKIHALHDLDERSYAFSQKMHEEYKACQAVLKEAEASRLRQMLVSQKKGGVIVSAREEKGDIVFSIENLFEMHVSTTLFIENISGYETEQRLPYGIVLRPKEKRQIIRLKNSDVNGHAGYYTSHISWVKGSVDAKVSTDFLYALPYRGTYEVSQGFNGKTSHKGSAKYAVDFSMPIGTPVYAARGGRVVEIVQKHDRHGMEKAMQAFANYVIIEHSDMTLGRYFHLKQNSVQHKIGDEVKTGEFIALSGNTGRTSGAHLHFVVTRAVKLAQKYQSQSIPLQFECSDGIIKEPVAGQEYCSK